jgi:NADPH-dependent curcumin reductase CurA
MRALLFVGKISQYNDRAGDVGPRPYWPMITKQIRMEGFLVFGGRTDGRKVGSRWRSG